MLSQTAILVKHCLPFLLHVRICREVLECFRKDELLKWSWFESTFVPCLRDGVTDGPAPSVFSRSSEIGENQWEDFRKRVVEHVSCMCLSHDI